MDLFFCRDPSGDDSPSKGDDLSEAVEGPGEEDCSTDDVHGKERSPASLDVNSLCTVKVH